jgi:hypothetical protein
MLKAFIIIVILIIGVPFLLNLRPERLTYERIEAAYRAAGYTLENSTNEGTDLDREETEGWSFYIDGYRIEVLRYTDRAKMVTNLEYLKPDSGSLMVESMNIGQSLGQTKPTEKSHAKRRGSFIVYVRGPDRAKCHALTGVLTDA